MKPEAAARAAEILARRRLGRQLVGALPGDCRPADEAEGYQVQDRLHERLSAGGLGPVAGYKIGCTTKVMQDYLGIDRPCAGRLFARRLFQNSGHFRLTDFIKVAVETEVAVRLGRDLPRAHRPHGRETVAGAVAGAMASIEIVDDRYDGYAGLGVPTLIADDFFNAAIVVGPPVSAWQELDLAAERGRLLVDGREIGAGRGADILGHPLEALAWLADALNDRDLALKSGDIVTLGSVVETYWIERPCRVAVRFQTLGEATAVFTA
jgi:2-oxo-3-hexenedioate decarboxylase/2-keto-4-pentenoate hydratase